MKWIYYIIASLGTLLGAQAEEKPNILIFLVDDMGPMDTSLPFLTDENGQPEKHPLNDYYKTPGMEKLAAQGIRFETFYANSVCSPSRVSLMTGQSSARHKTTQWINPTQRNKGPENWNWKGLTRQSITLPRILQENGYQTIHIGKAHFSPIGHEGEDPTNLGFDSNVAGAAIGRPDNYSGLKNYGKDGDIRQVPGLEAYHGTDTHLSDALTLEMCKAIDDAVEQGKPFFAHMAHYALHAPFQPDPRFIDQYNDDLGEKMPAYASLVEGMDKSLIDLLAHLGEINQAENTLVLFLGDNGSDAPVNGTPHDIGSSAPIRGKKATHYEGGVRAPFIAAWAKPNPNHPLQKRFPIAANSITTEAFATIEDIMPTVLTATGTPAPDGYVMDGLNLMPSLAKPNAPTGRSHFLMHFPHEHRSSNFTVYRENNWKIIHHFNEQPETYELFDLENDPSESENLAEKQPERLKQMIHLMEEKLKDAGAQRPNLSLPAINPL